jgi:hypothetical protein
MTDYSRSDLTGCTSSRASTPPRRRKEVAFKVFVESYAMGDLVEISLLKY